MTFFQIRSTNVNYSCSFSKPRQLTPFTAINLITDECSIHIIRGKDCYISSHNNLCFSLVNSLFLTFSYFHRDIIVVYVIPLGHKSWISGCSGYTKQDVILFCYDRPFFSPTPYGSLTSHIIRDLLHFRVLNSFVLLIHKGAS